MFCVRVMVGVIILYDHVHPVGAFAKTSPIDVSIPYFLSSGTCFCYFRMLQHGVTAFFGFSEYNKTNIYDL